MGFGEIVERRPILAAQPQEILEAGRGDQYDARTAALEERVGRDRSPMHQDIDAVRSERFERAEQPERRVLRRGAYFADFENAIGPDSDEIGERPADVDADAGHGRRRRFTRKTLPVSVSTTTSRPTQSPRRTYNGITSVVRITPET